VCTNNLIFKKEGGKREKMRDEMREMREMR
jgi:hypothetical protein